jgi:hypothetical protein
MELGNRSRDHDVCRREPTEYRWLGNIPSVGSDVLVPKKTSVLVERQLLQLSQRWSPCSSPVG